MNTRKWLVQAGMAGWLLFAGMTDVAAQQGAPPPGGGGNFGPGNFDPARIQQMLMDRYREQLEVTDDATWKVIQERVQKVTDARREIGLGGMGMGGMSRMFRRPGGEGQEGGQGRRAGAAASMFGMAPSVEEEALQKVIDAKASNAELKAALAKFVEARKQKQANLDKAQGELRQVLSVRQEAIASVLGLL